MDNQVKKQGYFDVIDTETLSLDEQYAFFDSCRTEDKQARSMQRITSTLYGDSPLESPFVTIDGFNQQNTSASTTPKLK